MAQPVNKEWFLNGQIVGVPTKENFTIREIPYVEPTEGEFLIKNDYFSVDPYLRGQFNNPDNWSKVVNCYTVGTVILSKNDKIPVGATVTGILPAQLYVLSKDDSIRVVSKDTIGDLSLSTLIGSLGMPGATAHGANKNTNPGDVVFINASCGIVGSMLGQLAKAKGAKLVVGTAGGEAKCKLAVEKYGYDYCLNYKEYAKYSTDEEKSKAFAAALQDILAKNNVKEFDIYYDLVGSWISDAIFQQELIRFQGKAIIIGGIDEYNNSASVGPRLLMKLIYRAITVQGFIVFAYFGTNFPEYTKEFEGEIAPAIKNNTLKLDETIIDGFDNISEAFIGLFNGVNIGKMVVKP